MKGIKDFFVKVGKAIAAHKIVTIVVAAVLCCVIVFSCLGAFVFNRYSQGTLPTDKDLQKLRRTARYTNTLSSSAWTAQAGISI